MDISRQERSSSQEAGVTLIELMVVVVIIAILAAVAMPSYQDFVRKASRAEAKGILLETAQFMERNYTTNGCYHRTDAACATAAANTPLPFAQSPKTGNARYTIAVAYSTVAPCTLGQCFSLSAAPTVAFPDPGCGTLAIDNAGVQTSTAGNAAECWQG